MKRESEKCIHFALEFPYPYKISLVRIVCIDLFCLHAGETYAFNDETSKIFYPRVHIYFEQMPHHYPGSAGKFKFEFKTRDRREEESTTDSSSLIIFNDKRRCKVRSSRVPT